MCERDAEWVRRIPEPPSLSGPLAPPLIELWEAIEGGTIQAIVDAGALGGLPIVDAESLDEPTAGIAQLAVEAEAELFREVTARFACRVCPADQVAQRSDSGAALGHGWGCVWHTVQTSPTAADEWVTVMDHLFVVTTLDDPDERPILYHLTDLDVRSHFASDADMRPCPPHSEAFKKLLAEER